MKTATKVLVTGNTYNIFKHDGIKDQLPVGVYQIGFSQTGPYLTKVEDIELPKKVYNNDTHFINHAMKSWENLEKGMLGLGLVGGKGLGKSLTCNLIAQKTGLPVIKLTQMVGGTGFLDYIKQLDQDFVFFIDEFEKIFPKSFDGEDGRASQEQLLSFLDGGTITDNKVMFLITSNSATSISDFLKNRPSRLRYFKEYKYLDEKVIKEVIDDLLVNKDNLDDLLENLPYEQINLDSLIKIIQEMNLHNTNYTSFREFFNFKAEGFLNYNLELVLEDGTTDLLKSNSSEVLWSGYSAGVSRKLLPNGKGVRIQIGDMETITENPKEPRELEGYYWHNTDRKDEDGDIIQEEVYVKLRVSPGISMLSEKYSRHDIAYSL